MLKNGLFLASIGLIMFLFSVNPAKQQYDFLLMTSSVFFITSGGILFFKGIKESKEDKHNGN